MTTTKRARKPCPTCAGGQRLPEGALASYHVLGMEIVSVEGWTGILDAGGAVLAWGCCVCGKQYRNPALTALLDRAKRRR